MVPGDQANADDGHLGGRHYAVESAYNPPSTMLMRQVATPSVPTAPSGVRDGMFDAPEAVASSRRRRVLDLFADWWPVLALAVLALAIRWPHLWYIPQFTDEVFDAQVSYGIYQGKRPLTGVNAYTGAFFYYVQAALFWLFGPSIYTPRLLVMVLGVGAVIATYGLGAEIGRRVASPGDEPAARRSGQVAGLLAGGLLATSAVHVLTNSHLAWPHGTVLLYLTAAFWLVERALRVGSGAALVGGGLTFGLAQQQHPTMLLLWPVFLGYVGWRGRAFFRTRWAYLALAAFLVGIGPLLVYNWQTGLGTLRESEAQRSGYEEGRNKDFSYRSRAAEIMLTVARLPASAIDRRPSDADQPIRATAYLTDPAVVGYSALGGAGLLFAARLGAFGPVLAVTAFLVLLPLFPASHDNLPRQGRYLMPLLPLAFAGAGALGARAWARSSLASGLVRGLVNVALVGLVAYPLVPLWSHYAQVLAAGETNARYFITLGAAERERRPGEVVVLDPSLQNDRTGAAGTALRTFDFMLDMREIAHVTLEQSSERIERRVEGRTVLMIADQRPGSAVSRDNAAAWTLEPLPNDDGGGFTLWRLTRR